MVDRLRLEGVMGGTFVFPAAVNAVTWDYELVTHMEETRGGRVVQVLGVNLRSCTAQMELGHWRRAQLQRLLTDMRDILTWHRDTRRSCTIVFSSRNVRLQGMLDNFSFSDALENVTYPFSVSFSITNDISGVASAQAVSHGLDRLNRGIGLVDARFVDPLAQGNIEDLTSTTFGNDIFQALRDFNLISRDIDLGGWGVDRNGIVPPSISRPLPGNDRPTSSHHNIPV